MDFFHSFLLRGVATGLFIRDCVSGLIAGIKKLCESVFVCFDKDGLSVFPPSLVSTLIPSHKHTFCFFWLTTHILILILYYNTLGIVMPLIDRLHFA